MQINNLSIFVYHHYKGINDQQKGIYNMYNDIVSIGPITIHGYGLMIGLGILFAVFLADKRAGKKGLDSEMVYNMAFLSLIFGFIGAKLLYCIVEIKSIISNPMNIINGTGFVVYGGIIGGTAAVIIYCRIKKLSFLRYFDLIVPSLALAQGFGRIGCFLAGCCYGKETESAIGITFHNSLFAPNNVKLLPTQLMSSAGDFLIAAALIIFARRNKKPGHVGALYLILYSVGRFIIEIFRDDSRGNVGGLLSTSQFIALFILATGVILWIKCNKQTDDLENVVETNEETIEDEQADDSELTEKADAFEKVETETSNEFETQEEKADAVDADIENQDNAVIDENSGNEELK